MLLVMDVKSTIFSYNKPLAPCSHHVMACDDLVSPKHDQAISRAVSAPLDSNGSSLSICHVLKPERFAASCIFSLMNSLFSIVFSSLLQRKPFPKMPGCFSPLKPWVFSKHETLRSSLQQLSCTQRHFEKKKRMKCKFSATNTTVLPQAESTQVDSGYFLRKNNSLFLFF